MSHELARIVANALNKGAITHYQLGVTQDQLDRLLDAAGPWTTDPGKPGVRKAGKHDEMTDYRGKRPDPVITDEDADSLNEVIMLLEYESPRAYKNAHMILEAIVAGDTNMHDDIRQELAEAEWRLATDYDEITPSEAKEAAQIIDRVLGSFPTEDE